MQKIKNGQSLPKISEEKEEDEEGEEEEEEKYDEKLTNEE